MFSYFHFRAGLCQKAYNCILSAKDFCAPRELYLERAQLYWQKGRQEEAINTLNHSICNHFMTTSRYKEIKDRSFDSEKKQCAKVRKLKANDPELRVFNCNCVAGKVAVRQV